MTEFSFNLTLAGTIRLEAANSVEALAILRKKLSCADSNLGAWPDGSPILTELSLSGAPSLCEIDGQEPAWQHETLIGRGSRFEIYEDPARGFRVLRLADLEHAVFMGDDCVERFRDNFTGDELDGPEENAEAADFFGDWCESNGELPLLVAPTSNCTPHETSFEP